MLSGRHFIILGSLASLGLLSIKESHEEVRMAYGLAELEKATRATRKQLDLRQGQLNGIYAPRKVVERAARLDLEVEASSNLDPFSNLEEPELQPRRSGSSPAAGARATSGERASSPRPRAGAPAAEPDSRQPATQPSRTRSRQEQPRPRAEPPGAPEEPLPRILF